MDRKSNQPVPEAIVQLQGQLDQFRSAQPRRTPLPESLWQAAVELARQHGVYAVASPLHLDYTKLKHRLNGVPRPSRQATPPSFVELLPQPAALEELVIEFESAGRARLRIQWKTATPPDWSSLLRAWQQSHG